MLVVMFEFAAALVFVGFGVLLRVDTDSDKPLAKLRTLDTYAQINSTLAFIMGIAYAAMAVWDLVK